MNKYNWFACTMDDGIFQAAKTRRELLEKLGKQYAQYIGRGHYEYKESSYSQHRSYTVFIFHERLLKVHGFSLDYEDNVWRNPNDNKD